MKLLRISLVIIVVEFLVILTLVFFKKDNTTDAPIDKTKIQLYVEGDSLFLKTLKVYKKHWKKQKPKKSNFVWYNSITWGSNEEQTVDITISIEYKEWEVIMQSIENALIKRELINGLNLTELKNQRFSPQQQEFATAIQKIVPFSSKNRLKKIKKRIGNVSALTLSQIAEIFLNDPDQRIFFYSEGIELDKATLSKFLYETDDWEIKQRIDSCIVLRTALNNGRISELLNLKFRYSEEQQELKNALTIINDENRSYVGTAMYKEPISKMNFNRIADFIHQRVKEYVVWGFYLNGTELKLDILNQYKDETNNQTLIERIDSCIALRRALNFGRISELGFLNFQFSEEQQRLKNALTMINNDNKFYVDRAMNMYRISRMNLNEIADFILEKINDYEQRDIVQNSTINEEASTQNVDAQDNKNIIISYLQGGKMKKQELEEYLSQTTNAELHTSIKLALKFWTLDGMLGKSYFTYNSELKKDEILKNSYMKHFIDKSVFKIENVKYVKDIPRQSQYRSLDEIIHYINGR